MEDIREFEIQQYRKQIKNLKEMYDLMNNEIEALNLVIGMSMSDDEFYERRKEAYRILKEREEEE